MLGTDTFFTTELRSKLQSNFIVLGSISAKLQKVWSFLSIDIYVGHFLIKLELKVWCVEKNI